MQVFRYVLEAFFSILIVSLLMYFSNKLFMKKFNVATSSIFSFVVIGLFLFLLAPYTISFPQATLFYLPILIFWLLYNLARSET
jgi:hypothetical protein